MVKLIEQLLAPFSNTFNLLLFLISLAIGIYLYRRGRRDSARDSDAADLKMDRKLASLREELLKAAGNPELVESITAQIRAVLTARPAETKARTEGAKSFLQSRPATPLAQAALRALLAGDTKLAEDLFRHIAANEPSSAADAHFQLGALAENRGDFDDALAAYSQADKIESGNPIFAAAVGRLALKLGKPAEAEEPLARAQTLLSEDSPLRGEVLHNFGEVRRAQKRYRDAESLHLQAFEIRDKLLGDRHLDTAASLQSLGDDCYAQERYADAEPYHRQALEIRETATGAPSLDIAASLRGLGFDFYWLERYTDAEGYLRRATEMYRSLLGERDLSTASSLVDLGCDLTALDRYAEAEEVLLKAIAVYDDLFGTQPHRDAARARFRLGRTLLAQAKYDDAERCYREARVVQEAILGPNDRETAMSIEGLGRVCFGRGQFSDAERYFRRAYDMLLQSLGEGHRVTSEVLINIGGALWGQGRFEEAAACHLHILSVLEKTPATHLALTAACLQGLAVAYHSLGRYGEAETYILRALPMIETIYGKSHSFTAWPYEIMGDIYMAQGSYLDAETCHVQALNIYSNRLGESHPETGYSHVEVARALESQGRHTTAADHYRTGLATLEKSYGDEHWQTVGALYSLAELLDRKSNPHFPDPHAATYYERALTASEKVLPENDHIRHGILECYSGFLERAGHHPRAAALRKQLDELKLRTADRKPS